MKEILKDFEATKVDKEVVASIEKKKEHKLIASQKVVPGHLLFKYNPSTKELSSDIKYKKTDIVLDSLSNYSLGKIKTSVEIEEGFIYIQALNKKNAIKKLNKLGYETIHRR